MQQKLLVKSTTCKKKVRRQVTKMQRMMKNFKTDATIAERNNSKAAEGQ